MRCWPIPRLLRSKHGRWLGCMPHRDWKLLFKSRVEPRLCRARRSRCVRSPLRADRGWPCLMQDGHSCLSFCTLQACAVHRRRRDSAVWDRALLAGADPARPRWRTSRRRSRSSRRSRAHGGPQRRTSSAAQWAAWASFSSAVSACFAVGVPVTAPRVRADPFDTMKVRLQTQPMNNPQYTGLIDCVRKTAGACARSSSRLRSSSRHSLVVRVRRSRRGLLWLLQGSVLAPGWTGLLALTSEAQGWNLTCGSRSQMFLNATQFLAWGQSVKFVCRCVRN